MSALTRIPKLLRQLKVSGAVKASQAEVDAGTNDAKFVSPLRLAGMTGNLTAPDFTSAEQAVTADTLLEVAHSLAAVPTLYVVVLRFTTAQHGFSINDEVLVGTLERSVSNQQTTVSSDSTNVTIVQGDVLNIVSQSTFNVAAITVGNVRWIVRAWV